MDQVNSIALARIGIGVAACVAPSTAFGAVGLSAAAKAPYLGRMFGVREIAVGVLTLMAAPGQRRSFTMLGIGVDAVDAAAGILAARSGTLSPAKGAAITAVALAAVGGGVAGLQQISRRVPRP